MLSCSFIFVFFTRYSLTYLSLKLYISSIKLLWYKVYGIRFRSEITCSSDRPKPMFLSSLCFALLAKLKIWQTTETYSPQTFSVAVAVVAPAVVICLNSLICFYAGSLCSLYISSSKRGSLDQ